jgi:hypothetical protein
MAKGGKKNKDKSTGEVKGIKDVVDLVQDSMVDSMVDSSQADSMVNSMVEET